MPSASQGWALERLLARYSCRLTAPVATRLAAERFRSRSRFFASRRAALTELRGLAGFEEPKCLKLLAPVAESLHYKEVGEGSWSAVILGGGCCGSSSLSFSSSSLSSGSGSV